MILVDVPPINHDHRNLVYNDDDLTVYCPGCGMLWQARAWTDENDIKRVAPYKPLGMLRSGDAPFMEE